MLRTSFKQKVLDTFRFLNGYSFVKGKPVDRDSKWVKMGGYLEYIVLLPLFSYFIQLFDDLGENSSSIIAQLFLGIAHAIAVFARSIAGIAAFFTAMAITLFATVTILPVVHAVTRWQAAPYKAHLYGLKNNQGMTLHQFLSIHNCSISKMRKIRTDLIKKELSFFAPNGKKFVITFPDSEALHQVYLALHKLGLVSSKYPECICYIQQAPSSQKSDQSDNDHQKITSSIAISKSKQQENIIIDRIQNLLDKKPSTIDEPVMKREPGIDSNNGNLPGFNHFLLSTMNYQRIKQKSDADIKDSDCLIFDNLIGNLPSTDMRMF